METKTVLVFTACKCLKCGTVNAYHRCGCSCWPSIGLLPPDIENYRMQYGFFMEGKKMPDNFISFDEVKELLTNDRQVWGPDGLPITLADFDDA